VSNITDLANAITSKTKRIEIPPLENKSLVHLSDDQAHYVLTVLRMFRKTFASIDKTKENSPQLRIFANGEEWLGDLLMMKHNVFTSKQIQRRKNMNPPDQPVVLCRQQLGSLVKRYKTESPMHCWLCIAPPKNKDRVRWMIEKTTELDCTGYIFIDTDRSEETTDDYQKKKFPKMQAYCIEAAEQCERLDLPHFITVVRELNPNATLTNEQLKRELLDVPNITKLNDFLQVWSEQKKNGVTLLICRERHNTISIWDALEKIYKDNEMFDESDIVTTLSPNKYKTKAVVFLIGPEGGWSPSEQRLFNVLERDFPDHIYNVALSRTILRTETAAMTAMSTFAIHRNHILINRPPNTQTN
jgi:RsmE family RNA methyltransferase